MLHGKGDEHIMARCAPFHCATRAAPLRRRESMERVVAEMGGGATLEEVQRVVEELSRIH